MGLFTEYLDAHLSFPDLSKERKRQLQRIADIRGRQVLVYAADLNAERSPTDIRFDDLQSVADQLTNLSGDKLDLVLETPGGSGEVAEDIVDLIRENFREFAVIIPGWAKSAGTLVAMGGDDILMGPSSAVGPIDAQLSWQGKRFSAGELLDGIEAIKKEAGENLNLAYIPILQGISPGELQRAQNALSFAKNLVSHWLETYKFKDWTVHSSSGDPVTEEERHQRADAVAEKLCAHDYWLTHARSIKIASLREMGLKVEDYSEDADLYDAITRYYNLLRMTFSPGLYKLFETPSSQIYKFSGEAGQQQMVLSPANAEMVEAEVECPSCGEKNKVQANLGKAQPLKAGNAAFPSGNKLKCRNCKTEIDLTGLRRDVEAMTKKPIVT